MRSDWAVLADVELLAELFGVGRRTVRRWCGDVWFPLPVGRVGGVDLWRVDEVRLFVEGRRGDA